MVAMALQEVEAVPDFRILLATPGVFVLNNPRCEDGEVGERRLAFPLSAQAFLHQVLQIARRMLMIPQSQSNIQKNLVPLLRIA